MLFVIGFGRSNTRAVDLELPGENQEQIMSVILKRTEDWPTAIRACRSLREAKEVHARVTSSSCFQTDRLYFSNLIIEMYGRCGSFQDAHLVFLNMHVKNTFSWRLFLLACLHNVNTHPMYMNKALEIFHQMPHSPDPVSATALLLAYSQSPGTSYEQAFHLFSDCLSSRDVITWNCILRAAAQRGSTIKDAETCFQRMPHTSLVSWNSMLAAYVHWEDTAGAERVFLSMPARDVISWTSMIRLTSDWFLKMPAWNTVTWNSKLATAESLEVATSVFLSMPARDVISWGTLLATYVSNDMEEEARELYTRMPCHDLASTTTMSQLHGDVLPSGFDPDVVWWNSLLASRREAALFHQMPSRNLVSWNTLLAIAVDSGEDGVGHAEDVFNRIPHWSTVSMNQMLSGLARRGDADAAKRLLETMESGRNSVSWCITVEAYAHAGRIEEALQILEKMPHQNVLPWTSLITAYADTGQVYESWNLFQNMSVRDSITWNAMIAVHAQSGEAMRARMILDRMPARNIVSWTAAIAADCHNGQLRQGVCLFQEMLLHGVQGDPCVFQCILFGCSHTGDINSGVFWLHSMTLDHGVTPAKEHYSVIVDLLGRADNVNDAKDLLDHMPFKPDVEWTSLTIHTLG